MINVAYPRFEIKQDVIGMTVDLWVELFKDIPYSTIETAVRKLIYELKYPPSIADIAQKIESISNPNRIGVTKQPIDYWNELIEILPKAYGYVDNIRWDSQYGENNAEMAEEIFDKLSAENKRYFGSYENFLNVVKEFDIDNYQKYEKGTYLRTMQGILGNKELGK